MRNYLATAVLFLLPSVSLASPYFRLIDPSHPQISAGMLINPSDTSQSAGVTEVALITHSVKDGSIIPASWQSIIPPESWVPLQVGTGGKLDGNAIVNFGSSANVSPILANAFMRSVGAGSKPWLVWLKNFLMGSGAGQLRLGYALQGNIVNNGSFQSGGGIFPGHGLGDILGKASRIDAGLAWQF